MKNLTKIINALKVLFVCGFLLNSSLLRAQPNCAVTINNNFSCDIQLDISFFEKNPGCVGCPGNPINITVAGPGSTVINCNNGALWACTLSLCDLSVTFTNPTPTPAGPFFYNSGSWTLSGLPAGCVATTSANIKVNAGTIDINP